MVHTGHTGHVTLVHTGHLAVIHAGHAGHVTLVHTGHLAVVHTGHTGHVTLLHSAAIHARHAAMVHAGHTAHPHVIHGQKRARINRRYRRLQSFAHGQGSARISGAIHGLGENGVSLFADRLDDHVIGFCHGDAKLIDADRFDVLAVGSHDGHFQAWNTDVEVAHG